MHKTSDRCVWCRIFGPEVDCQVCGGGEPDLLNWEAHKILQELKESEDE